MGFGNWPDFLPSVSGWARNLDRAAGLLTKKNASCGEATGPGPAATGSVRIRTLHDGKRNRASLIKTLESADILTRRGKW